MRESVIKKYCQNFIALLMVMVLLLRPVQARADTTQDVLNILSSLTCETQGVGELLTYEHAHTCVPMALSSIAIATIISPLFYLPLMLKLKIGFDELNFLKGNCDRVNRADPANPKIKFALCSNIELIVYRAELVAEAIVGVALAVFEGKSGSGILSDLKALVVPDYNQFHDTFTNGPGDSGLFFDITVGSPILPWKIQQVNDTICVSTYTLWGSLMPLGCKYIREPYPTGIYQQFFASNVISPDTSLSKNKDRATIPQDAQVFFNCSIGVGGCAQSAMKNSQTLLPISSIIIECIRSTLMNTLISDTTCIIDANGKASMEQSSSLFHTFQRNMQRAVMAFLTLYVMSLGIKLLLGQGEVPPPAELIMYAVKLILVIYFSVGININDKGHFDGMTSWIFPLLLSAANEMASWIGAATPSGLCAFPVNSELLYQNGMGRLALWDTLDCKVAHYLGYDTLSSMFLGGTSGDNLGNSVPPYIFLLIPALITGQINLVMLALAYPLVVMSVAAYLVTTFSVCLIAITVCAVLAPIYVPFALFEQTKGYFDSWYKLMISFTLQPVVIVGFMTVMFAIFDQGFYSGCKYIPVIVQPGGASTALFKVTYVLDTNEANYAPDGSDGSNYSSCKSSLGYLLNQPVGDRAVKLATKNQSGTLVIKAPPAGMAFADYQAAYADLAGIKAVAGTFFSYFSLIGGISKQLIINLFACILMLYLMRELSGQLSGFASDIADSASVGGTTISPRSLTGNKIREKLEDYKDSRKQEGFDNRKEAIRAKGGTVTGDKPKDEKSDETSAPKSSLRKGTSKAPSSSNTPQIPSDSKESEA